MSTPARRRPHNPESIVYPSTAAQLLDWAAAQQLHVGLHHGPGLYGGPGTRTARMRATMYGTLLIAGGDARGSSRKKYDYPKLYQAQETALEVLSDMLAGGAMTLPPDTDWHHERCYLIAQWSRIPERTAEQVAEAFSAAARRAERASAAAAARPGLPPWLLRPASTRGLLEWAASHLEQVGLWLGPQSHDPAGFAGSAPCTLLFAFERASMACAPRNYEYPTDWVGYLRIRREALELLARHTGASGDPGSGGESDEQGDVRLRTAVDAWGHQPGLTTVRAVQALRAAAAETASEAEPAADPSGDNALF